MTLGTTWTTLGEGSMIAELRYAARQLDLMLPLERRDPRLRTDLLLTGSPLQPYDAARIVEALRRTDR